MSKKSIQTLIPLLIELQQDNKSPEESFHYLRNHGFENKDLINHLKPLNDLKKKNLQALLSYLEKCENPPKKEKGRGKSTKKVEEDVKFFTEEEIFEAFKSEEKEINKKYGVKDLKIMYRSIYNQEPRKNMKKLDLIHAIKNRIRIVSRAISFKEMS